MNGSARIYLDHAATTPVRPEVLEAMLPYFAQAGGNPSSLHAEGRRARAALDEARHSVARALGAQPREIVFTAGGSEADCLAILGSARAWRERGRHVVTAATEHDAVLHAFDVLRDEGFEVTVLPVLPDGNLDAAAFEAALRADTVLVSLMLGNNEIGTLHPVAEFAQLAHACGALVHCDAVQAAGQVALDMETLGVDLLSLSAHKCYGPKGTGALYVRSGTPLAPLVVGGGQENGLRAGTENVAGCVGFAHALDLAVADLPQIVARVESLRDAFVGGLLARVPNSVLNGARAARLPNNANVGFDGVAPAELAIRLDLAGVAVSTGSACNAGAATASHVLRALGPEAAARGGVRFSLGRSTSSAELETVLALVAAIVAEIREDPPVLGRTLAGPTARFIGG